MSNHFLSLTLLALSVMLLVANTSAGGGPPPPSSGWIDADTYNKVAGSSIRAIGQVAAIDSSNNRWTAGVFSSGKLKFDAGTIQAFNDDLFVVKFSSTGTNTFVVKYDLVNSGDSGAFSGAKVDSSDRLWLYGWFKGTLQLNATTVLASPGRQSAFLIQLSSTGQVLFATKSTNTLDIVTGELAINSAGELGVVGTYKGDMAFGSESVSSTSGTNNDVFVFKFTSAGVPTSSQHSSGSQTHYAFARSLDFGSDGKMYITGIYNGDVNMGSGLSSVHSNLFVASLSTSLAWVNVVDGVLSGGVPIVEGNSIVFSGGLLYVTGRYAGSVTLGSTTLTGPGSFDTFTTVLSTSLSYNCAVNALCSDGKGLDLTVDTTGAVWATGLGKGATCNFGAGSVNFANFNEYLVKVSNTCAYTVFTSSASSSGASLPYTIVVDGTNKVWMTGHVTGSVSFGSKSVSSTDTTLFTAVYQI